MLDDILWMDATAQAKLVREKEVKPIELVESAIACIERLNPKLNAVVTAMYDHARDAATGDMPAGPFSGVPYLLKDFMAAYAGVRMTSGSKILQNNIPQHDCELVKRLKKAGLIIVGKTNTSEFGILPTAEPQLFGPSLNPWAPDRATGGSSGGSAAAVASGMVAMAHASDGGGSIRIPASCCGVFGLKPTRARNPLGPEFGDVNSGLLCEHAVTRSVRDSAALLDATCGPDDGDPYWAPPPQKPFLKEVGADPGRLRIAFLKEALIDVPVHADCVAAVMDAADLCSELGHEVIEDGPDMDGEMMIEEFTVLWASSCAATLNAIGAKEGQVEPLTWALYEEGRQISASDYVTAVKRLQRHSREFNNIFKRYDVLLTPTLSEPPLSLGTFASGAGEPLSGLERAGQFAAFTPICNVSGHPAMSVPLFWNSDGLPIGTQYIGRFGDEATLFRLAAQLEEARPWGKRKPEISA